MTIKVNPGFQVPAEKSPVRRILILRTDGLGDLLLFLGALEFIRKRHPEANIWCVASDRNAFALKECPWVDRILQINSRSPWTKAADVIRLCLNLLLTGFDVCINPLYDRTRLTSVLTILSGAKLRIGFKEADSKPSPWYIRRYDWAYNRHLFSDRDGPEVLKNWEVAKALDPRATLPIPSLFLGPNHHGRAQQFMEKHGLGKKPTVAIGPGASKEDKQWGVTNFVSIINALRKEENADIILVGSNPEFELCQTINAGAGNCCAVAAGQLDFWSVAALIARCDLYVGNDSSLLHIAGITNRPLIGLYFEMYPTRFRPVGGRQILFYAGQGEEEKLSEGAKIFIRRRIDSAEVVRECKHLIEMETNA